MIVLNGTNSSDPDSSVANNNDNLTFSWAEKEDDGNAVNTTTTRVDLEGDNTATPIFVAPSINSDNLAASPMTLTFELRVTDERNSSSIDTVNITVHDSPKTEIKTVKKTDPIEISMARSASDDGNNSTAINATAVTLEVSGFGSTSTEESIVPMDTVFAIDSSNSMEDNDPDNLRLEAAKSFLDRLNQTRDRAGVVNWDSEIEATFGLTSDFESLKANIDQTTLGSGTNLDEGLRGAVEVLDSSTNSTGAIGSSSVNRNESSSSSSSKTIVFLTDGIGDYTPSSGTVATGTESPSNLTESTSLADLAKTNGYRIFSIGLNIEPGSDAEANLIDMASATGGQYFSSPTAENLAEVFNAIHQTVVRVSNTAPENVDVIEVTGDYIEEGETSFSIQPTSINQTSDGKTMITWMNVSQHVGNKDDKLTGDETFVVTFTAGSSITGNALPVNSAEESFVSYVDALENQKKVQISQAYINVIETP
jgi:Ca-activated chloride channel family protein